MNTKLTIAVCNFNTTEMTNNLLSSIFNKVQSVDYDVIVFDNSDKNKFSLTADKNVPHCTSVTILDNTNGKYINFDTVLKTTPYPLDSCGKINNYASLKHCYSIQYLLNTCKTEFMVLFDSDTELIHDIDFINDLVVTAADVEEHRKPQKVIHGSKAANYTFFTRFLPIFQLFNVKKIKELNLKYFDFAHMFGIKYDNCKKYDTGAYFYECVVNHNHKYMMIDSSKYVRHLSGGSWRKNRINGWKTK